MFICLLSMAGRTDGPIKTKLGMGTQLNQRVFYASLRSRSFGATWRMLIKLLTETRKGRENSSAKRDKYGGQRPTRAERIEACRANYSVRRTGT